MGNYSTLWIAKNKDQYNENTDIYQEVKYDIPLFWIALFEEKNVQEELNEYDERHYYFETTTKQAIEIFKYRIPMWSKLYRDEKLETLAKAFLKYLEQFSDHFIILDVSDILSMYLDYESEDAKNEMIDMIKTIELLNSDPKLNIPFKHWLPSAFEFKTPKDRYLNIDGLGKEILPCPEVDDWLEQNEPQNHLSTESMELDWSIDEETFYRMLVTKGEVHPSNLMGYQHRYRFLTQFKNNRLRQTLLYIFLSIEIFFNLLLLLLLFFTTKEIMARVDQGFLKIGFISLILILIMMYIFKKIFKRIQYFYQIKPII